MTWVSGLKKWMWWSIRTLPFLSSHFKFQPYIHTFLICIKICICMVSKAFTKSCPKFLVGWVHEKNDVAISSMCKLSWLRKILFRRIEQGCIIQCRAYWYITLTIFFKFWILLFLELSDSGSGGSSVGSVYNWGSFSPPRRIVLGLLVGSDILNH